MCEVVFRLGVRLNSDKRGGEHVKRERDSESKINREEKKERKM